VKFETDMHVGLKMKVKEHEKDGAKEGRTREKKIVPEVRKTRREEGR